MTPTHKCFSMMLLAVLMLLAGAQQTANGVPAFLVPDQRFSYPLPDNSINTLSFLVFSTEGEITGASVHVRDVKIADGEARPLEAVKVALESTTVTTSGQRVTLTLEPKFFLVPGEYRVTLFFQGNATPSLPTTIVINRLGADINLDELKDQTVALTRLIPFWSASENVTFHLRENTKRVALNDLKVVGQGIYLKETKELYPGSVVATPVPANPTGAPVNVPPGQVQPLQVSFSGLSKSGTFDTRLLVTSTSFAGEKAIPIKVTVRDWVLFPLLAIALGVAGGYFTRRLVAVERPRNENRFQLLRLQNEVERFRDLVSKTGSKETIRSLLDQLKAVREKNELGDFNAVKAELPKIQAKLDEFRKAQVQAAEAASVTRNGLVNQVELLENDPLTDEERKELRAIKDKLADVERLLSAGMVDDAQVKLENASELLGDFRLEKLSSYFDLLTTELDNLSLSGAAATEGETFKTEIRGFLKTKDFDKASEKLEDFKNFIKKKKAELNPPDGAPGAAESPLPAAPRVLPEATLVTRIVVTTAIEERIAGNTLDFEIHDPENFLQPNDRFLWFFDDVGTAETENSTNSHRYNESGRFRVRVEIRRGGTSVRTLSEMVTIAPSAIELARASVLRSILRNEMILSLIALVLAVISGVLFLYIGKIFGSLVDYLTAILWGFGIDNSVKGFAAVLAKISGPDT